eukprot:gene36294-44776_t
MGDASHPYGPGGQGISMALKDAQALCELIVSGMSEEGKQSYQDTREKESKTAGEAAEKRNQQANEPQTEWAVYWKGVFMQWYHFFNGGVLKM